MIFAVAAVLASSVRSLRKERARLLDEFATLQSTTARELASDLQDRLRDIEEDSRVIATLVKQTREVADTERGEGDRTMLASFKAMATVVRHYRSLALFDSGNRLRLSAVDPTETKPTVDLLMKLSERAATLPRT